MGAKWSISHRFGQNTRNISFRYSTLYKIHHWYVLVNIAGCIGLYRPDFSVSAEKWVSDRYINFEDLRLILLSCSSVLLLTFICCNFEAFSLVLVSSSLFSSSVFYLLLFSSYSSVFFFFFFSLSLSRSSFKFNFKMGSRAFVLSYPSPTTNSIIS